ncbi:MAG TPA: hypothetical protein VHA52_13655, partial [Candidatus Babeliaceae bacterium]|nr:hypothetical protein [Candidatus Babeliaceae bacterium]
VQLACVEVRLWIPPKVRNKFPSGTYLVMIPGTGSLVGFIVAKKLGYPIQGLIAGGCTFAGGAAAYICLRMQQSASGSA